MTLPSDFTAALPTSTNRPSDRGSSMSLPRDPYLIPGTNTLVNKAGITDADRLAVREKMVSTRNLAKIRKDPIPGSFDRDHLDAHHKAIFGELYAFAGVTRFINVEKAEKKLSGHSVAYEPANTIDKATGAALKSLNDGDYSGLKDMSKPEQMATFAKNVTELWRTHPYREGNTRTIMTFASAFAKEKGFELDAKLFAEHPGFVRDALVVGTLGKPEHLTRIMTDARERQISKERTVETLDKVRDASRSKGHSR